MEKLIRNFEIPLTLPLQKGENLDIFHFIRKDIIINQMQTVPKIWVPADVLFWFFTDFEDDIRGAEVDVNNAFAFR